MSCLVCGTETTCNAHLIPQAFTKEVISKAGEKHVLIHAKESHYKTTNTGVYDNKILCALCDGIIGKYEGIVYSSLCKIRGSKPRINSIFELKSIDGDVFIRFASGIAWKYSVTKKSNGQIDIGPYQSILKAIAFEDAPIPSSVDVMASYMQDGSSDVYFYRTPFLDRQFQVNFVRFSVGGFVFFLKIDKRRGIKEPPPEHWLKGKVKGKFYIAQADDFEEWTKHRGARNQSRVRKYFQQMAHKSSN